MGTVTAASVWTRFWFPPVPLERVAIFRIAVTVFALLDVALFSNYVLRYAGVDPVFLDPVYLLRIPTWLGFDTHPVPPPGIHLAMYAVMILALGASAVGYRTRLALSVAAPLYLYHWALFNSFGKVNHGKIPAIIALFVLIVAPAGARLSYDAIRRRRQAGSSDRHLQLDPIAGWSLRIVGMVVVFSYLLSVLAKLMNSGLLWPLQPVLAVNLRFSANPISQWLSEQTGLLVLFQTATLVIESLAFLAFAGGWRRNLVLLSLGTFHLASYFLLGTEFLGFLICYLVFFRLEDGLTWARERLGPGRPTPANA